MLFRKKGGDKAAKKVAPATSAGVASTAAGSVKDATAPTITWADEPAIAAAAPTTIELDFATATPDALTPFGRRAKSVEIADGHLVLGGFKGAISKKGFQVTPGAIYRVEYIADAIADPTSGTNDFRVGPVFYDGGGKVIPGWKLQAPIAKAMGTRVGIVESTAPEEAVSVHVGAHGSWIKDGEPGNGIIGLSSLALKVL